MKVKLFLVVFWLIAGAVVALAQTTGFTYQGRLTDGGTQANGNYDLQFALWDSPSGGAQVGSTQTLNTVAVSNGVFTVSLDFGANAFPGASRFLEISARPTGSGSFTLLSPRQPITSTPYAVRSLNAASADSVPASGVPAGSGNYIQNTTAAQTASLNITGGATIGGNVGIGSPPSGNIKLSARNDGPGYIGVFGESSDGIGVWGASISAAGVFGQGKIGVRGEGTSFFSGDTTPLPSQVGSGVAIGFGFSSPVFGGYIFAYNSTTSTARDLYLNHPGGNVGIGTTSPMRTLHVAGRARIGSIPTEPSAAQVCFNVAGDLLNCGASSLRLKTNVQPFEGGLNIIRRLRPISFDWKDGSGHDIGLGAEDVAQVAPSFTFTDEKGEVAGVKYERLNLLLINAIKEQQAQIQQQQQQIKEQQDQAKQQSALLAAQQKQLKVLKKLVCRSHRRRNQELTR